MQHMSIEMAQFCPRPPLSPRTSCPGRSTAVTDRCGSSSRSSRASPHVAATCATRHKTRPSSGARPRPLTQLGSQVC